MVQKGRYRFGKALRLRRRREFLAVQGGGLRWRGRHVTVVATRRAEPEAPTRLGVTASRKIGCAVRRNRIKRTVREAFRLGRHEMPGRLDLVVIPRASAAEVGTDEIGRELAEAARALSRRLERGGCR